MRVKYLYEVYGVRNSGMGGLKVEYSRGAIGIEGIDIPNFIIIEINEKWGVSEGISK